ncbi:MAG TPA: Clp protease N-terminal domain-containing protein [Candidatus Dormibacteraeota bacterium]|nr:Clp protease N-terminal domain-containing protein [Candidatus Dormibacteraeota bacterium]
MYPFERFTDRAKKALVLAQEEAESAGHNYIGTEHLLLGLLREQEGLAGAALNALGVELDGTRNAIQAALSTAAPGVVFHIVPTTRVKKVIEMAFEEAQRMGDSHVGTQHLLVGLLIEEEGLAARILVDGGVTLEKARAEIERLLKEGAEEPTQHVPLGRRMPATPPMLPELQQLLLRAQTLAAGKGSSAFGLDHLLETMVSSPAGTEVLARLLDLRRIAAMIEQALAAQDFDTAAKHRTDEKAAREALEQAVIAWRRELDQPGAAQPRSS